MPWKRYGWPIRKKAIEIALAGTKPDILCVQEALEEQVMFLAAILPGHRRVGVGRDDGRSAGEHCSIFFDRTRFEELGGGTFWLEEPADLPPAAELRMGPKRICTWARLRDRRTGRAFRVYNTHQYLTEPRGWKPSGSSSPGSTSAIRRTPCWSLAISTPRPILADRRLFEAAGLISSAGSRAFHPERRPIIFTESALRRLDDILVNRSWRVDESIRDRREAGEHLSLRPLWCDGGPCDQRLTAVCLILPKFQNDRPEVSRAARCSKCRFLSLFVLFSGCSGPISKLENKLQPTLKVFVPCATGRRDARLKMFWSLLKTLYLEKWPNFGRC